MFVVPTTTTGGWLCKIFSVALEVFQLGALCPAAIFRHKDCLHYTAPLGVPLSSIRTTIITFGYFIWSFIFMSLPLAIGGFGLLVVVSFVAQGAGPLGRALRRCSPCLLKRW